MTFTIIITTRNRCEELRRTCQQLQLLLPDPSEVIICADGCNDGTATLIEKEFKAFRLVQNQTPQGSVASRDRMIRMATGEIVLSLDDDSYPLKKDFLDRLGAVFESHPEAAVITFYEQRAGMVKQDGFEGNSGRYVSAYPNCAAAMRRSRYLEQPGFPVFFEHMYEEPDYALQCYAAGRTVWYEPSLDVFHHVSTVQRQPVRRHHLNARNELWSTWMRCPWPWLPLVSLFRIARQLQYASTEGWSWAVREPVWWCQAIKGAITCLRHRAPISWNVYYGWMRLARTRVRTMPELRKLLRTQLHE